MVRSGNRALGGIADRAGDAEELQRELATRLVARVADAQIPRLVGVALVAVVLWGELPRPAIAAWLAIGLLDFGRTAVYIRRERAVLARGGPDPRFIARNLVDYAATGLAWSSPTVLGAFWGTREGELLGVLVLLAMLSMTTATCVAAARPLVIAAIAAFVGPAALAQLLGPHHLTRLVIASIGFAGIAYAIHHELHRMLVDAIRTRHDNGRLAESLQEHLAERDPSTGLLNRTSFLSATEALAAHRLDDAVIVVEVGNVDGLSAINELYGEGAGNAVIAELGRRLSALSEQGAVVARLGGDEFAAAHRDEPAAADAPVRTLLDRIAAEPVRVNDLVLPIRLHHAHVARPAADATASELVSDAIGAVHGARARRRSRVATTAADPPAERRRLADLLRGGLDAAGVEPWFQPIVDARSRDVVGWEALIRWRHPDGVVLGADRFLPLIGLGGYDAELLDVLLRRSLEFLLSLDVAGFPQMAVHVNVSANDLHRHDLAAHVATHLAAAGVDPSRLVLEVTEDVIVHFDTAVRGTITALDEHGVHLAVDDFGTGFSSMSHLLDLPTDHLKIDRRFVSAMPTDATSRTLVAGVIGLARGLGLRTVAEGVETEDQAAALAGLGCAQLQGFLFAPALAADAAVAYAGARGPLRASLPAAG